MVKLAKGPVNHRVEITSIRKFILDYLGFDIEGELQVADWLTFPQQKLLGITTGEVFHDDIELKAVREYFSGTLRTCGFTCWHLFGSASGRRSI